MRPPPAQPRPGMVDWAKTFNAWFSSRSLWILLAITAANLAFPGPAVALHKLVFFRIPLSHWTYDFPTVALTLMMLSASAQCRLEDFGELARRPRAGLMSLFLVYALAPGLALGLSSIALGGQSSEAAFQLRVGLFFVALMPIALTCTPWVRFATGNVAFTLALIALTTALSVATVPIYIHLLPGEGHRALDVPIGPIIKQLVLSVTLPLAAGMAFRRFAPKAAGQVQPVLSLLGNFGLIGALSTNVAGAAGQLLGNLQVIGAACVVTVILNLTYFAAALLSARRMRLSRPGLPHADAVALVLGSGMRSTGTAMVVGAASFPGMPLMTVPAALYSISQQVLASVLARALLPGTALLRTPVGANVQALVSHLKAFVDRFHEGYSLLVFEVPALPGTESRATHKLMPAVRGMVRSYDFVSVLSSGSFAIVLHSVPDEQAFAVAQRIAATMRAAAPKAALRWSLARGTPDLPVEDLVARARGNRSETGLVTALPTPRPTPLPQPHLKVVKASGR